jgi:hypothetical protein
MNGSTDIERVCRSVYVRERGVSILRHEIDLAVMRYEFTSVYDVVGHRGFYAMHRAADGEWWMKLVEVEGLGEQYDRATGKLIDGWRFSPLAWADRECPLNPAWLDSEDELSMALHLEQRTELLEWTELSERLVPWVETTYQRCCDFFETQMGWDPPQHDAADVQASADRMAQARRRTLELRKEHNKLVNGLLAVHRGKRP